MPIIKLKNDVELYYEDQGNGKPILFIHGVWMSSRFFHKQIPYFRDTYRAISIDLRSHGRSAHIETGHTIANYACDLHNFIHSLALKDVILVGWSMGAFVVWEYIKQFGEENIQGLVIVDELASDFKWPDFPLGAFDFPTLIHFMREIQINQTDFLKGFLPLMFKETLSTEELSWMLEEVTKIPASIASAILFDQSVVDYRKELQTITKPTLLCFGREEKLIPVAAGEHLQKHIPNSKLVIFENSCHCPFLEEADYFNSVLDSFVQSLS
ncbi:MULTISPECIES: alpha/beta fold hydrolase [unclassified Bacillus cereus group]|uniref:alpha/beta fold hydrolase n=1 Tax=unclassified Bacillus cereus group TaxID=2750818 RepID=UPI001F59A4A3|nr:MULTISPECIES: alpha/beta hydrolase [unclassified Bacillus cereus group]